MISEESCDIKDWSRLLMWKIHLCHHC